MVEMEHELCPEDFTATPYVAAPRRSRVALVLIAIAVAVLFFVPCFCWGNTTTERTRVAVAIAVAKRLSRGEMPDAPPNVRIDIKPVRMSDSPESVDPGDRPSESTPTSSEANRGSSSSREDGLRAVIDRLKEDIEALKREQRKDLPNRVPLPDNTEEPGNQLDPFSASGPHVPSAQKPPANDPLAMSMSLDETADDRVIVRAHTSQSCKYCKDAMKLWGEGDDEIKIEWTDEPLPSTIKARLGGGYNYPVLVWEDETGQLAYPQKWALYSLAEIHRMVFPEPVVSQSMSTQQKVVSKKRLLTPAECKQIAINYRGQPWEVAGATYFEHLVMEHKFKPSQLTGLSQYELMKLHGAAHTGQRPDVDEQVVVQEQVPGPVSMSAAAPRARKGKSTGMSIGTVQARDQIEDSIAFIDKHVGEGIEMVFGLKRSGPNKFDLIKKGTDWSLLLGREGRISLSAIGAPLPVDDVTFGYRIAGDDIVIDAESLVLKGAASKLSMKSGTMSASEGSPAGLTPGTVLAVFNVLKAVYSLLNTQADLNVSNDIVLKAVLKDGVINVSSVSGISIKLVKLWTFNLEVQRLTISPEKIDVYFTGSMLIKHVTLKVSPKWTNDSSSLSWPASGPLTQPNDWSQFRESTSPSSFAVWCDSTGHISPTLQVKLFGSVVTDCRIISERPFHFGSSRDSTRNSGNPLSL